MSGSKNVVDYDKNSVEPFEECDDPKPNSRRSLFLAPSRSACKHPLFRDRLTVGGADARVPEPSRFSGGRVEGSSLVGWKNPAYPFAPIQLHTNPKASVKVRHDGQKYL
jgi:hypothetical protein